MGDRSMIIHSSAAAIILFSTLWHATHVEGCYYGRYGKYENWPSVHDWEELLALLTGKYWDGGWGWKSPSYGSNSLGGGYSTSSFGQGGYSPASFGGGGGGYSSFSSGYKGASEDDGSNYFSAPASQTSLKDGPASSGGSIIDTVKVKEALNSLFAITGSSSKKKKPTSTSSYGTGGGGGSGIGQSFIDTPGPGYGASPPKSKYKSHPDEPPLSYGPPYDDSPPISGWPGGGSGGGSSPSSKPISNNGLDPGLSNSYGPPYDHGPPDDPGLPYDHDPNNDHSPYHTIGTKHRPAYDHYHGSSHDQGPPQNEQYHRPSHDDSPFDHHGPPRENHSPYRSKGHRHRENQFQSDYDTFPGYDDKRRRQGRRRWSNNEQAGPPTKPRGPANRFKALRPRPPRRRMLRNRRLHSRHQRIDRRKINTSFGGYKVDHSRIRYG